MKKTILFNCFCLLAIFSQGQSAIALVGGLHGSTITPAFLNLPDTSKRKTTATSMHVTFGFVATIPITKVLAFQSGVLYTAKGADNTQFYDTTNLYVNTASLPAGKKQKLLSINTVLSLNYIEMPLLLLLRLPIKGNTKFLLGGGPQLSLLYNGNTKTNNLYVTQAQRDSAVRFSFKGSENDDLPIGKAEGKYRILHFGAKAFGGMEFGRVFITINYTKDLQEFFEENNRLYKAETIGVNLGIYLGKRNDKK